MGEVSGFPISCYMLDNAIPVIRRVANYTSKPGFRTHNMYCLIWALLPNMGMICTAIWGIMVSGGRVLTCCVCGVT